MVNASIKLKKIPKDVFDKWQSIVDTLAIILDVSDALITKADLPLLEILKSSKNEENTFKEGSKVKLAGHFCEYVIQNRNSLHIVNALKKQKAYPEIKQGLISYLGFPLEWPDGSIFGTICVHDKKENKFSNQEKQLLQQFKDLIESHLKISYQNNELSLQNKLNNETTLKLRQINTRYNSIYNNIEQGICLHEIICENNKPVNYRILDANPAYEQILDIPLQEAIGSLATEVYNTSQAPFINIYARVAESQGFYSFERYFTPLNKYFHITVTSPEKGKFITLFNDISWRKNIEQQIQSNTRRLSATLKSIGDAVIATDNTGCITIMNKVAENLTGWNFNEAKGKPLREIFNIVNSTTRNKVENPVKRVLATGKIIGLANHTILISKNKTEYQIADSAAPIKNDLNQTEGVVLVFRDVTDKYLLQEKIKENEQMLSVLFNNLPGIAFKCDNDRNWTMRFLSKGCKDVTGYETEELINNNKVSYGNLIVNSFKEFVRNEIQKSLKEQNPYEIEYMITTKNNDKKWVWEQGQGVFNEDGKLVNIQGFITDITNRKINENKIKYMGYHDSLTGLYNRNFFEKEVNRLDTKEQLPLSLIMADLNGLKLINDAYGHYVGDKVLIKTAKTLKKYCQKDGVIARWGGDEFVILLPRTSKIEAEIIHDKIKANLTEIQVSNQGKIPISISMGIAEKKVPSIENNSLFQVAEKNLYRDKLLENRSTKSHLVQTLLKTLQEKSQETEEHARRMNKLAYDLGEEIGLSHSELDRLSLLATLHDIGKTIISGDILNKPGKLTPDEWSEIQKHPNTGYRICSASEEFSHIAVDILSHHEKWNGTGYPRGIKGDNIPLLARIIAIVDAFDVMTNGRPYNNPMSMEAAIDELKRCAGSQFDPRLVEIFVNQLLNNSM